MDQEWISQTALDQMVTEETSRLLKASLPYLPASGQQIAAVYAKARELFNTLRLFSSGNADMTMCSASAADPMDMLSDIRRFSCGDSRRQIDRITNTIAVIEILRIMNGAG